MQTQTPTCTTAAKAITLPCPQCGEPSASISVHLAAIDDPEADSLLCNECNVEFSIESVRTLIRKWGKVLAWIATAPDVDAE
jgi:hypothetical protein